MNGAQNQNTPSQPAAPAGGAPAAPAPSGPPAGGAAPTGQQQPAAGLPAVGSQQQEGQGGGLPGVQPSGDAAAAGAALTLPEGAPDHWKAIAKDAGNDPSKFMAGLLAHEKRSDEEFTQKWAEAEKRWVKELVDHPEYGKDLKASDDAVNRALAKHDPTGALAKWIQKNGYGNHPAIRLALRSVGLSIPVNDRVAGRAGAPTSAGPKSDEQITLEAFDHPTSVALRQQQMQRRGS